MSDSGYTPSMATIRDAYMSLRRGSGTSSLEEFERAIAARDAVIREDQAKKDATITDDAFSKRFGDLIPYPATIRMVTDAIASLIRGQSFTGKESE